MTSLVQVDPGIIRTVYGRAPVPAILYSLVDGDDLNGVGGIAWMGDGRCWMGMEDVDASKGHFAVAIVRQARDMLKVAKQMGETAVFTVIDRRYPRSEKLLRLVGFEFFAWEPSTDGVEREVWHVRL